ncbi:hypothetical protein [Flavobacterium johnsoniae]|uniref:Uncharacterized protein n=1 Tax=Flavobacterium johnsoniae TaxID=986 RepID=A0A1J7CKN2_FLAJO|nr:hypothetical protein [Flavobacterium johnsoniae]OIV42156.1 hypothetical protein BKM63_10995 [Flavobacterium johnsoniae]
MDVEKFEKQIEKIKEDAGKNIINHFNRIHDKLFTSNNIFIAGYFALSRVQDNIDILVIIIPLLNLIFLILIEYLMMEKSRKEYRIEDFDIDELIDFVDKKDHKTNLYSLLSLFSTLGVFIYFMYLLICK